MATIADAGAADVGHQVAEWQRMAVVLLQGLAEDHGVDRGEAQVGEEAGFRADRAGVFAAVEVAEQSCQVGQDLGVGHRANRPARPQG